jgi:hypothetical protein
MLTSRNLGVLSAAYAIHPVLVWIWKYLPQRYSKAGYHLLGDTSNGCIIRMKGSWSHGCVLDMRTKHRLRMHAFREPHRWMTILQSVVEAAWLLRGCCMVESWPTIWLSAGMAVVATESGSWPWSACRRYSPNHRLASSGQAPRSHHHTMRTSPK